MREPKRGEVYRHYKKGTEYLILCVSTLEADGVTRVVNYSGPDLQCWCRTVENFTDIVMVGLKRVPRFELVIK